MSGFNILMDYPTFGNNFLVGDFVETYVKIALKLAREKPSLEDFYEQLLDSVSQECKLTRKAVLALHHPFHWTFFNPKDGNSPFEFINPKKPNDILGVRLKKRDYNYETILDTSTRIIKEYGNNLIEKRKHFLENG